MGAEPVAPERVVHVIVVPETASEPGTTGLSATTARGRGAPSCPFGEHPRVADALGAVVEGSWR